MKNILSLALLITLFACKKTPKDYIELSGKLEHTAGLKTLSVLQKEENYEKIISIKDDGSFSDTLKVKPGRYTYKIGNDFGFLYLENDKSTQFTADLDQFYETLKFTGDNAEKSNFFTENIVLHKSHLSPSMMSKSKEDFNAALETLTTDYNALKTKYTKLDANFFEISDNDLDRLKTSLETFYAKNNTTVEGLAAGTASPKFENYENYNGTKTSLDDFKGKYVYIDVWATWCAPCKAEIPALQRLEKAYHGKNIAFVSLSIDDARANGSMENARKKWKAMVVNKGLTGVQLLAPEGWMSPFIRAYQIQGIPRFILIDPQGNIVNANAPRPSNPEIKALLDTLKV
jgi:thiol-disulfide isomerase/thioredoxin